MGRTLISLGVMGFAVCALGEDAPRATEHLMGIVVSVRDGVLMIETLEHERESIRIGAGTSYERQEARATVADLKEGVRVVVEAKGAPGVRVAQRVRIGIEEPLPAKVAPSQEKMAEHRAPEHAGAAGHPSSADTGEPRTPEREAHAGMEPAEAATATPQAGHEAHPGMNGAEKPPARRLFQSDMTRMAGMMAKDPMAGMAMPRWKWSILGLARLGENDQGGPSGEEAFEFSNWAGEWRTRG